MNTNPATSQIDAAHLGHPHKVIAALANYLILGRCQKVICFSRLPWITEDLCKIFMQRHSNKKVSSIHARNICTLASESLTWNISAFLNELHGCPQHIRYLLFSVGSMSPEIGKWSLKILRASIKWLLVIGKDFTDIPMVQCTFI